MKLILTISAMILFLITGCESGKQPANDFLTVDITANYPKKELILQVSIHAPTRGATVCKVTYYKSIN